MYDVSLGLIIKDDARIVREWLAYHMVIGVQHFWIACNDDDHHELQEAVQQFMDLGIVTVWAYPGINRQASFYNALIQRQEIQNKTKWLGLIDSDEFIHLRTAENLPAFLMAYDQPDIAALAMRWRTFGSNGHKTIQPLTLAAFTRRAKDGAEVDNHLKVIVRPDRVLSMASVHNVITRPGFRVVDEKLHTIPPGASIHPGSADFIRVNHYNCRSEEDYARKIARGRADANVYDNPSARHSWDSFRGHDRNEVFDDEITKRVPAVETILEAVRKHSS